MIVPPELGSLVAGGINLSRHRRLACNTPRGLSASLQLPLPVFARPAFA
jgi:hypothetical protein